MAWNCGFVVLFVLAGVGAASPSHGYTLTNRMGLFETNLQQESNNCHQLDEECSGAGSMIHQGAPVCGTNGVTYRNMCLLRIAICKDGNVLLKHDGECTAAERCLDKRAAALARRGQAHGNGIYVPECQADGTFEPMQCHSDTGYCWCVSPDGVLTDQASETGSRIKFLNCSNAQPEHRVQTLRTPTITRRPSPCTPNSRLARCSSQEGCTIARRSEFIENMAEHILKEYKRAPQAAASEALSPVALLADATVWKFVALDTNSDNELGKREYRSLRKLVRRNVKPKSCARNFPVLCDTDANQKVSRREWQSCWASPLQQPQPPQTPPPTIRPGGPGCKRCGGPKKPGDKRGRRCKQEHKNALRQMAASSSNHTLFVPACDNRGRFRRYQCYGSQLQGNWYCWCVSVRTGDMLRHTTINSLNGNTPQCKKMVLPTKTWPRCEDPEVKHTFLTKLLQFFSTKVGLTDAEPEVIANRIFSQLDRNNNNKLDKREKKALQNMVRRVRGLRPCGRSIHKTCDADDDRAITPLEWRTCVTQHLQQRAVSPESRPNPAVRNELPTRRVLELADDTVVNDQHDWAKRNPFVILLKPEEGS